MKKILSVVLLLVLVTVTACGGGGNDSENVGQRAPMAAGGAAAGGDVFTQADQGVAPTAEAAWESWDDWAEEEAFAPMIEATESLPADAELTTWETPDIPQPAAVERRVIRNSDISVETLDFEDTVARLERIVDTSGGFVENSAHRSIRNHEELLWVAEYVIRVPVARFDAVNSEITRLGNVTHFTTSSEDVTMMFLDLQSRLSIREEEERRVEAMRDAATELRDILTLERELSDLRVVVDRYRRRMTEIDQLAAFSTIRLLIIEVEEPTEEEDEEEQYIPATPIIDPPDDGFGTRIAEAFRASVNFSAVLFEVLAIVVVSLILPLAVLAIPIYGGYIIYKKKVRGKV
ncbi:MAG: DUF4349 domain-containing protein [Defluviitaleaceae bacterium]|nr:DUF4349 domain-containing protein [Defluviitaleaceae bacterium]